MKALILTLTIGLVQNAFANSTISIQWNHENVQMASDSLRDGTYIRVASPLIAGNKTNHNLFSCYSIQTSPQCNVNALRDILGKKVTAHITITERRRSCAYCDPANLPESITYELMTLEFSNGLVLHSNVNLR